MFQEWETLRRTKSWLGGIWLRMASCSSKGREMRLLRLGSLRIGPAGGGSIDSVLVLGGSMMVMGGFTVFLKLEEICKCDK